ncbi:DNA recombination protein RmuC [Neisseria meningitidis]|uniref:DNA recombination protein RmuC n=1 Tax=Neisseria meningitidis TaxID=487 RepID=UPI000F5307DA|nr:DNA recombination protein RmuC [Neisseria meningitidis]RQK25697.1 DNA recombination protein RmuC [Neisseria meningitidis]
MELMAVLLPLAALVSGVLFTWLLMKSRFQGVLAVLNAQLAEKAARCDFVEQAHAEIASELAALDGKYQHLQDENYALGNRFSAAEKQIAHLQEKEAESVRLKQSYIELQEKAQGLAVENERLATQLGQERKAFADQYALERQIRQRIETDLEKSRQTVRDVQNDLSDVGNRFAAAEKQIAYLQEKEAEAERLRQSHTELQEKAQGLAVENERLTTQIEQERLASEEKLSLLGEARKSLSDQFQNLANTILEEKSRRFTEQNREQLHQVLNPLNERIHGFGELVRQTYDKESRERLTLENELKRLQGLNAQLHSEAKALTNALTGTQNKVQGNWGEMILETVLENSGLQKGREYVVQAASVRKEEDGGTRRLQPDVLVNLPDNKQIVIDSKVSLTAYVRYTQAADADVAARELAAHVASIRAHMKGLSLKDYTDLEGVNTLDFVFMFIPVEPAYLLALQHDAGLFQECFDKRIMLVGPSTLLATLRTVANIWRNEQQNQNALAIADEGGKLYDKFVGFVQTLESVGKGIDQAQSSFQTAFKQLAEGRGNLVGRAEKLRLLGVKAGKQLQRDLVERANEQTAFALGKPSEQEAADEAE